MKRKINKKNTSIVTIILGLILVIVVNIFSSFVFHRWDLTAEKRYTLSKPTLELLKGLDDYVYFKVMLNSKDLPVGFQRLKQETKEMLDEFRAHSKYIEFEFIDPTKSDDPDMVNASMQELVDAGLSPTKIFVETKTGSTQQIIFRFIIKFFLLYHKYNNL
jgi:ABC-2 type transport system permease protein